MRERIANIRAFAQDAMDGAKLDGGTLGNLMGIRDEADRCLALPPAQTPDPEGVEAMADAATAHLGKLLSQRIDWLNKEWKNGGNFEHLSTREKECAYIVARYLSGASMQDAMRAALTASTYPARVAELEAALRGLLREWDALGCGDDDGQPIPDNSTPAAVAARAALTPDQGAGE